MVSFTVKRNKTLGNYVVSGGYIGGKYFRQVIAATKEEARIVADARNRLVKKKASRKSKIA